MVSSCGPLSAITMLPIYIKPNALEAVVLGGALFEGGGTD